MIWKECARYICINLAIIAALIIASSLWAAPYQTYRKDHCEWCGTTSGRLVVHHIQPQHLHPELANDHPENYVTLCDPLILRKSGCHWKCGHRGISWSYDNSIMMKLIQQQLKEEANVSNVSRQ